jgi:nitroreductase
MAYFDETALTNFQARYGTDIIDNDYPTNEFIENILARKTVRRFDTTRSVDTRLYSKLIAAAQSSPTSSMIQPWSVILVKSLEQKLKIVKPENHKFLGEIPNKVGESDPLNITAITECDAVAIWCLDHSIIDRVVSDLELYQDKLDIAHLRDEIVSNVNDFDITTRSLTDATIAAQTFCLAAESMGLGTMYCGSIRSIDLSGDFHIPDRVLPLFGICVGYPKDKILNPWGDVKQNEGPVYIKPRLSQEIIVHAEFYKPLDFEKVKEYNSLMKRFYQNHNKQDDWFDRVIRRSSKFYQRFKELVQKHKFFI